MTEETMEVAKLLRDLVKDNQNLLVNYEALLPKLQEAGVKGGDYRAIHNALQYKIGEVMTLVDTSSLDSIKQGRKDLQRTLQANNMLPARIDFIVDVFTYALGWQEAEERLEYAQESAAGESNPARVDAVFQDSGYNIESDSENGRAEADDELPVIPEDFLSEAADESEKAFTGADNIWLCTACGEKNDLFFCVNCGRKKTEKQVSSSNEWQCVKCGRTNSGKFCTGCGSAKASQDSDIWYCTQCGRENHGRFCTGCGKAR